MKGRWSDEEASEIISMYGGKWGSELALRTYTSRLIGKEKELVLHGGGNTSVKGTFANIFGKEVPAIFVKGSGHDLACIEPDGHVGLDLESLKLLQNLPELSDEEMVNAIRTKLFHARAATPSIETLLHIFISAKYVDHTHANAILALTNQVNGEKIVQEALGSKVIVLDYVKPGFELARAAAEAFEASPESMGMVLLKHGLLTWGKDARESYERTIALVTKAEEYLANREKRPLKADTATSLEVARERYSRVAPVLRGLLAVPTGNPDWAHDRFILRPLISSKVLSFVGSSEGKQIALTPPLTADHLIRTKALPLWIDEPHYDDETKIGEQLSGAIKEYARDYGAYFKRHSQKAGAGLERFDSMPRVILMPGLGAVCAGCDINEAEVVKDITAQTLATKMKIAAMGKYEGLSEKHFFDMEYFSLQHAKLDRDNEKPLRRSIALVTGAGGAIGAGICEGLLKEGCHVAATDLPGEHLESLLNELRAAYGERIIGVHLDVTDVTSVAGGFDEVIYTWGGVDLVVANAGLAHVSPLADMDSHAFRKLEEVNVEGTLNVLSETARIFKAQGTGGDVVLISTKNVFAPGAKFGAYSATKAAAHQLARIASQELAGIGVRVNMVSPDAVFSHGGRKSGLWAEVGPDRMRARGLSEKELEEYYRSRNLLKARVTATHVARAVLFFATHQTPTTGATIPVDGGLPDATPR